MASAPRDATTPPHGSRRGTPLIKIVRQRFLKGPNLYTDGSATVLTMRGAAELAVLAQEPPAGLGAYAGLETHPGGIELAELIGEARKGIGKGADGWELALAIAERAQIDHMIAPARGCVLARRDDEVEVAVPADSPEVAGPALQLACVLVLGMRGGPREIAGAISSRHRFNQILRAYSPDMSTLALARKAVAHDIPVYFPTSARNTIQMGQGRYARLAMETVVDPQSTHAVRLAGNKWTTLSRLRRFGLPALPSALVNSADEAVTAWRKIGAPVAIKPVLGGKGAGISLNLDDERQIRRAHELASRRGGQVLVERYATGDDFRLTVIEGRMLAAAKRVAASVTGDGKHTVRQLIEALNADPRRGAPFEKLMERVRIDERLEPLLAQQGLALDAVPARGRVVKASLAANISQGGTAVDVTDIVHPDNRAAVELAARACHALVAGVDFFGTDISRSWREGNGWILEVNTSPGFRPHWIANPAQDLMLPVLRVAFPAGAPARVPTAGVTGSMGKTTTCQLLAHIARSAGRHPALSTTQGTWSGDAQIGIGDLASGRCAADLLSDPAVDFSVAELARGGLIKAGMALDAVDVAAVLNLTTTHVGLNGIETREELARVKAIPVRRAREWAFLYADEPLVLGLRDSMAPGAKLGLVSPDPKSPALAAHRKDGGCTVTLEGKGNAARIVVRDGEDVALETKLAAIPASDGGRSRSIAENAMFAAAMALKMGLTREEIVAALGTFTSDTRQNPGRRNRIEGLPFDLLVTWVDGVEPLDELIECVEREERRGVRHLYMIVAGNRPDEWIRDMGRRAAAHFDHFWCAELLDLRGRAPGEVPRLMAEGLREGGVPEAAITCLVEEERAVGPVLAQIEPQGHLTLMVFDTETALKDIETFRRGLDRT